SALLGIPADDRSNVGLKLRAPRASTTSTRPDTPANTAGRFPSARPIAANLAPFGSRCHDLDGQNTCVPSSVTTAGIRGSAAMSVTATAIASVGPSDLKMLSEDNSRARNATITTL